MKPQLQRIHAEVRAILSTCLKAIYPFECLSEQMARLRGDPSWSADEVMRIAALALKKLTESDESECCG